MKSVLKESMNTSAKKLKDKIVDRGLSLLGKKIKKGTWLIKGSGITLRNSEIKDIMKLIKSLENKGFLLTETTRKITSQEGRFLSFLRPLITAGLPLMKSVITPLAKNVLLPFGLSAGMPAAYAAIQKKIYGSGSTVLIITNKEMKDIMKIIKLLEESGLLIKEISEAIKNEAKEQKRGFFQMLLGTLSGSMLRSALTGRGVIRAGEGTVRASENF